MSSAPKEALWGLVLDHIQQRISEQKFNTWFRPIRPVALTGGEVVLEVPNPFFVDWFEEHNLPILKSAVTEALGECPNIRFAVSETYRTGFPATEAPSEAELPESGGSVRAIPADRALGRAPLRVHNLNPRFTFENFVVGRGNEFTYAACQGVAADPARVYNPLFIHGGVGLGKTHIMQAIGWQVLQSSPGAKIFYVSAEKFMNEMIESIQRGSTLEFRDRYRKLDVLLIDDIQFMSGKESTQEEFFHTFNTLYDENKQVVVTSDRAPKDIQDLEERLISRFNWGLVSDIQPPDLETRAAILRHKAEQEDIPISDSVIFFIAQNVRTNIRELEGCLVRLYALASLSQGPITIDLARDVLRDYIRLQRPTQIDVLEIQRLVAARFEVPVETLRGKRRTSTVALARQVAMFLTKQLTSLTLVEIGRRFGNRDHSTVLHSCSKVSDRMKSDERFATLIDELLRSLGESEDQRSSDSRK